MRFLIIATLAHTGCATQPVPIDWNDPYLKVEWIKAATNGIHCTVNCTDVRNGYAGTDIALKPQPEIRPQ